MTFACKFDFVNSI